MYSNETGTTAQAKRAGKKEKRRYKKVKYRRKQVYVVS